MYVHVTIHLRHFDLLAFAAIVTNEIIGTALVLTVVAMEAVVTDALITMETVA